MYLNILSWNIRHLRREKLLVHGATFAAQIDNAHIMFFYENKLSNPLVDKEGKNSLLQLVAGRGAKQGDRTSRLEWWAEPIYVGTNENVWVVYASSFTDAAKRKCKLEMHADDGWNETLSKAGKAALKTSLNETVMSELAMDKVEFRFPALADFRLTVGGNKVEFSVAAWHAPGPARGSSELLSKTFQTLLNGRVDLFVGDFNYTGFDFRGKLLETDLTLLRTFASTTITEWGPVKHNEGLDLVYVDDSKFSLGGTAGGGGGASSSTAPPRGELGRARAHVVPMPAGMTYKTAYMLTDHRPVMVELYDL